jgi:hypothetical protein
LQGCGGVLEGGVVERGEETHWGSVAQSRDEGACGSVGLKVISDQISAIRRQE